MAFKPLGGKRGDRAQSGPGLNEILHMQRRVHRVHFFFLLVEIRILLLIGAEPTVSLGG